MWILDKAIYVFFFFYTDKLISKNHRIILFNPHFSGIGQFFPVKIRNQYNKKRLSF